MLNCKKEKVKKGICCTSCGLPQRLFGEEIHGDVLTGECKDGLRDLMKGICWRVYRVRELKDKYLGGVGDEIRNEEDYKKWLNRLDTSGEMINGCRLMLNIWRERK